MLSLAPKINQIVFQWPFLYLVVGSCTRMEVLHHLLQFKSRDTLIKVLVFMCSVVLSMFKQIRTRANLQPMFFPFCSNQLQFLQFVPPHVPPRSTPTPPRLDCPFVNAYCRLIRIPPRLYLSRLIPPFSPLLQFLPLPPPFLGVNYAFDLKIFTHAVNNVHGQTHV